MELTKLLSGWEDQAPAGTTGLDVYSLTIIKKASADFEVFGSVSNFS